MESTYYLLIDFSGVFCFPTLVLTFRYEDLIKKYDRLIKNIE